MKIYMLIERLEQIAADQPDCEVLIYDATRDFWDDEFVVDIDEDHEVCLHPDWGNDDDEDDADSEHIEHVGLCALNGWAQ